MKDISEDTNIEKTTSPDSDIELMKDINEFNKVSPDSKGNMVSRDTKKKRGTHRQCPIPQCKKKFKKCGIT